VARIPAEDRVTETRPPSCFTAPQRRQGAILQKAKWALVFSRNFRKNTTFLILLLFLRPFEVPKLIREVRKISGIPEIYQKIHFSLFLSFQNIGKYFKIEVDFEHLLGYSLFFSMQFFLSAF
jgi:hypothetical protein